MSQTTTDRSKIKEEWVSHFEMLEGSLGQNAWSPLRKEAMAEFAKIGFPTTRHEEWKYTSVAPLLQSEFAQAFFPQSHGLTRADLNPYLIPGLEANLLVFVNGFFQPALSEIKEKGNVIQAGGLKKALENGEPSLNRHFGKYAPIKDQAFAALNTAFSQDGAFLQIAKGKVLEYPVHILHLTDARHGNLVYNTRNLILAHEGSEAKIISTHYTLGSHEGFSNVVTEVVAENQANLDIYFIQRDKSQSFLIDQTQIVQGKGSLVNTVTVTLEGQFVRNNLNFLFQEAHTECHLYGLYFLSGNQHVDNHTLVDHAVPHCESNELYKGVLDGNSTGVFNGKVMVRQDAQKTNAFQSNKNILLSNNATINTKPQLEIWADDVKCSHGATTGKLDQDAMFYLMARGIPEASAQALLTQAFASDVLSKIRIEPLREFLEGEIETKMKNRS
ncbi:MAG: Fe-S cluster assembly protein SufD [Bacteroidia bacterium]|nr:Fe-S cluster assembly protein SufD [Bacteroidia bacterium]